MTPRAVPAPAAPPGYGVVWVVLAVVVALALVVLALARLTRDRGVPGPLALVWVAIIVGAPVVGPVLYLLTRRRTFLLPVDLPVDPPDSTPAPETP